MVFVEGPIHEFKYPRIGDFLYELWRTILWPQISNPMNVSFSFNPWKLVPMKIKPSTVYTWHQGLPFFFLGEMGAPSFLSPTPRYRCSESALPLELLDVWLLMDDRLLALDDRDEPDDDDRLRDRDELLPARLVGLGSDNDYYISYIDDRLLARRTWGRRPAARSGRTAACSSGRPGEWQ